MSVERLLSIRSPRRRAWAAEMTYNLRLLGGVALDGPSGPVSGRATQQRSLAVLALLAVAHPNGCTRDKLVGYLWPDSDKEHARHRLADVLHVIRKALSDDALVSTGELLRLNPAVVTSDVAAFVDGLEAGDLEAAADRYGGPFLDGFGVSWAPEFERWVESQRQRFGDAYAGALQSLTATARAKGDQTAAVTWWKRLLAHDPYNSRFALGLIEALALSGDPANAWLVLQEHVRALREDLEVDPPASLHRRAEQLIGGRAAEDEPPQVASAQPPPAVNGEPVLQPATVPDQPSRRAVRGRRRWPVLAPTAAIVLLGAGWLGLSLFRGRTRDAARSTSRPYTIVAAVEGSAPAEVRAPVRSLIITELDRSDIVQVLPRGQIALGLRRAAIPDTTTLRAAVAQELAMRGHIPTVVVPALEQLGTSYSVTLHVLRAAGDSTIATVAAEARGEDALMGAVKHVVRDLRERLGEQPEAIAQTRPLRVIATPSFEALRLYDAGRFQEAVALDPGFAQAWIRLGFASLGSDDLGAERAFDSALAYGDRLSDRQRLNVVGLRAWVSGDLPVAREAWRRLARTGATPNNLGLVLDDLGRTEESVDLLLAWEPSSPFGLSGVGHGNLVRWLATLGRYEEAWRRVDSLGGTAQARAGMHVAAVSAAWARAESLAAIVLRESRNEDWRRTAFRVHASANSARGRVRVALTWLERLPASPERLQLTLILHQASGTPIPAEILVDLQTDTSSEALTALALWAAAAGDTAVARRHVARVRIRPPEARRHLDVPLVLAEAWVTSRERPDDAVRLFGPLAARTTYYGLPINQLSRWLAADAYDRAGRPDSAALWFERIAEWQDFWSHERTLRGLTESFARSRLVLLYSRMGRVADAQRHYKIFTETFTDPDPEVARLVDQAREAMQEAERRGG